VQQRAFAEEKGHTTVTNPEIRPKAAQRSNRKGVRKMIQPSKVKWGTGIVVALMVISAAAALISCGQRPHRVGSVNTEFNLIGPDHKIVIESYDDPKIDGITVFISKSQTGGIKGALGWRRIHRMLLSPCARPGRSR